MILAAAVASGSSNSTLNDVEPGVLGFLIVAGLGVILFFLMRNMNKQFKKLGPPPEETDAESAAGEANSTAAVTRGAEPRAITAGTAVQTGDPKQDAKAEGTAKRE